ncbi:hypothetical protein [Rhizobium sp. RU36D]|uniref:hypothetical protein n=1 Tax=Rhizobium sp. RU36D TaxID=1907415 RepID=UPI0009D8C6F8|nr:hypothetical protein [Rhizobium sp. RU36D]SMD16201.1 hypothetical protein SAMN05880593_1295 [Rhizobium sp. RU36D]
MFAAVSSYLSDLPWWAWAIIAVIVIAYGVQNDRVGKAIILTVAFGLIGTGLYGIWSSGVPQAAVGSFARHVARIEAEEVRVAAIRKEGQEQAFRVVCPDYFEQGWLDRQLSTLSWCNDYRERL